MPAVVLLLSFLSGKKQFNHIFMDMQHMQQDRTHVEFSPLQDKICKIEIDSCPSIFSPTPYSISEEAEGTLDKNPSERDLINQMCSYNQGAAKAITKTKDQGQDFLWDNGTICIKVNYFSSPQTLVILLSCVLTLCTLLSFFSLLSLLY